MVLGSAQYRRQNNEVPLEDDIASVASEQQLCSAEDGLVTTPTRSTLTSSGASDAGRVRFVDSTIRYHMAGGTSAFAGIWASRSGLEKALIVLTLALATFSCAMLLVVARNVSSSARERMAAAGGGDSVNDGKHIHVTAHDTASRKVAL
jgi:hypothetical protein